MSWVADLFSKGVSMVPFGTDVVNAVSKRDEAGASKNLNPISAVFKARSAENKKRQVRGFVAKEILKSDTAPAGLKKKAEKMIKRNSAEKLKKHEQLAGVVGLAIPGAGPIAQIALTPIRIYQAEIGESAINSAKNVAMAGSKAVTSTASYFVMPTVRAVAETFLMSAAVSCLPVAAVGAVGVVGATAALGGVIGVGVLGVALVRDAYTGNLPGAAPRR